MNRLFAATALGSLMLVAACGIIADDGPEIRLRNGTGIAFDSVRVIFPKNVVQYGELGVDAISSFHTVDEAYSYAYVAAFHGTTQYTAQPIDYVGESLLPPGRYSYRLKRSSPDQPWLWMELITESQ